VPSADRIPKNPRTVSPHAPAGAAYLGELESVAAAAGLDRIGVAPATPLTRAREQMAERVSAGLVNGMKFTYHKPMRSTAPSSLVPDARSVIVGVRSYDIAPTDDVTTDPAGGGNPRARVARYAWVDHYALLKSSLKHVAGRLRADGHRAVVFADDNSIVDREVAWLAGIGWYGKNANILVPGAGSFFVIGCIVTTADLPVATIVDDGCGTCTRCIPACPTGAIPAPGVIDANRCLSWLLQKPGVFPPEFREALHDRIYGCDDCQTACPFTRRRSPAEAAAPTESTVDILGMLSCDDATVMERVDRWYVHDRDATWVRRNLLVNLGNVADPTDPRVVAALRDALQDGRPVIRAHAVWAAARLGLRGLLPQDDPDGMVRDELSRLPALRDDL
jgi:epoxyqueuosine reductase